jgi:HEAT repeat protein
MPAFRYTLGASVCGLALLSPAPAVHAQSVASPAAPAVSAEADAVDDLMDGKVSKEQVAAKISQGLDSPMPAVRWRAARAAGLMGVSSPEIIAKLQKGTADKDWVIQLHSVSALGKLGDKSDATIDALTKAAVSSNARVATAAIGSLKSLEVSPEKLAETLSKALASDEDQSDAVHAVQAMVAAGAKSVPLLNASLAHENTAYWASVAIAEIGPEAAGTAPALAKFLGTTKLVESVPQALLALAAIGPEAKSAEPAITAAMKKWATDESVQISGLYALGAIGATNSRAVLDTAAASSKPFESMVASWALAKTNPGDKALTEAAVKKLAAGLASADVPMGHAAAHGLASLEIPAGMAAPYLMAAASDPEGKEHVVMALASLGEQVVPHADKALANPKTQKLAIAVLEQLGPKAAGATGALVAALDGADAETAVDINDVLANIGPGAAAATEKLAAELKSKDAAVRHSALYALREIGPKAAAAKPAVVALMESADASTAAGKFDKLAAAWTLARFMKSEPALTGKLVEVIQEGLGDGSEIVRQESIVAVVDLGESGKPLHEAVKKLAGSDPNAEVRATAEAATTTH